MSRFLRKSLLVLLQGMIECMLYLPVLILFHAFLFNEAGWLWLAPVLLAYPAGYWLNSKLSLHHGAALLVCGIVPAVSVGLLMYGVSAIGITTIVASMVTMYRGQKMALSSWAERFFPWQYGMGVFTYFAVSLVFGWMQLFQPYKWPLLGFGFLSLVLTLQAINKSYVNTESLTGETAPRVERVVKRQNRMFVYIVLAVAVLIVFTYQIQWVFTELWQVIVDWLRSWEFEKYEPGEPIVPDINFSPPSVETAPSSEESNMLEYLKVIALVLAGVAFIGGVWVLAVTIRHLPNLIKYLREMWKKLLQREPVIVEEGYVDEIVDLQKPKRWSVFLSGRNKERRLKWKDLQDNESRILFLYRQWLARGEKRGFVFKPNLTPRENGAELIAKCNANEAKWANVLLDQYSDIRYGGKKAQAEQLQKLMDTQSSNKD